MDEPSETTTVSVLPSLYSPAHNISSGTLNILPAPLQHRTDVFKNSGILLPKFSVEKKWKKKKFDKLFSPNLQPHSKQLLSTYKYVARRYSGHVTFSDNPKRRICGKFQIAKPFATVVQS